jgi:hypothetical protein
MAKIDPGHESDALVAELRAAAAAHRRGGTGVPIGVVGLLCVAADEITELRRDIGRWKEREIHAEAGIALPAPVAPPVPSAPRVRRGRPPREGAAPVLTAVASADGTTVATP